MTIEVALNIYNADFTEKTRVKAWEDATMTRQGVRSAMI